MYFCVHYLSLNKVVIGTDKPFSAGVSEDFPEQIFNVPVFSFNVHLSIEISPRASKIVGSFLSSLWFSTI